MRYMENFYNLRINKIIEYIIKAKVSLWFILLYILVEYLRPQSMYPALQVIPLGNIVLIGAGLSVLFEQKMFRIKNKSNFFINIFGLVVLASSFLAISPETSFDNIKAFLVLYIGYYLITNSIDTEEKLFIFASLILLISFKLSQAVFRNWVLRGFEYDRFGAQVGSGWLANSGELAIQLCIAFSISICFLKSLWPYKGKVIKIILISLPVIFTGGIIACGSRGSYLALAIVIFAMLIFSKRKVVGILLLFFVFLSLPYIISQRDMDRTLNIGTKNDRTTSNRLERWKKGLDMVRLYPILGVGYENWAVADKQLFHSSGDECHNIFIECMSELGYIGLIAFLLLVFSTYKNNSETIKVAKQIDSPFLYNLATSLNLSLLAYLVAGFFVTVLYYPYFWINLAMTVSLNNIAKNKYLKRQNEIS